MRNPFFNAQERRPRAFWRLLLQSVLAAIISEAIVGLTPLTRANSKVLQALPSMLQCTLARERRAGEQG